MNAPTATVYEAMTTYRELLQSTKASISEVDARGCPRSRRRRLGRRPRGGRMAGGAHPGCRPRPARESRVAHRGRRPRPQRAGRHLLRLRQPLGLRRQVARGARLRARALADRRLHRLEAKRRRGRAAAHALAREAHPLLAPHPDPRDRRGGPAEAARLEDPADRRRRPRLARVALPRGGRHRHARDRRRRHRRRDEPAAADRALARTRSARRRSTRAKRAIEALNPDVNVVTYRERLTSENIDRILDDGWDIIVDGADNFPTRYLVNDASVWRGIPVVHGSIYRFEGQVTVFKPHDGPCYRCLFPEPPPPSSRRRAPRAACSASCRASSARCRRTRRSSSRPTSASRCRPPAPASTRSRPSSTRCKIERRADCPVCGDHPTITEYIDYVEFCAR